MQNRIKGLLVTREPPNADEFDLEVEWNLMKKCLAARDAELNGLLVTVDAKADYAELLKDRLERRHIPFEKAKAASERAAGRDQGTNGGGAY